MNRRVILLHPDAPPKPALGQTCNGCGICCLDQPCPIGILATGRLTGPCRLLRWNGAESLYRCGALAGRPGGPATGGEVSTWMALWRRLARRWIAQGQGCDCALEPQQLESEEAR